MTPSRWTQFVAKIDESFIATAAMGELARHMSAMEGEDVTSQQVDYLQALDTDVVQAGDCQYALGWVGGKTRLHRLVSTVPADRGWGRTLSVFEPADVQA